MKRPIQLSDHFTYRKLLQFVFPSIVMMIFTSIYGVVDGLFVSNYAGKTAFAAINLVMPFIMVLGGIGFMIGTGGTALVSKILGEGDQEKARRYFSMMILFTVLVGLILTVLGVVFMEPVALFLGATPEMLTDCVLYGRIVNAFTAAFMLQNVFQSFLIAAEKPKLGLAATVAAGVTNMVLDALFVAVYFYLRSPYGRRGRGHRHGPEPVRRRAVPAALFPAPEHEQAPPRPDEAGAAADPERLRQRLV